MSDVAIFVSYAHRDNESSYGRIKMIVDSVSLRYATLTGLDVEVFFDTESIELGERWRERIRSGLASASILMAFISPLYLRSSACREELRQFLSFLGLDANSRLIIPLLVVDSERMTRFSEDSLWRELQEIQYLPVDVLQFEEMGSAVWANVVDRIARRIEAKLSEQAGEESVFAPPTPESADGVEGRELGNFDLLARLEDELPGTAESMQRYSEAISAISPVVQAAAPEMLNATSFSQRLQVARTLAVDLGPLVDRAYSSAGELVARVESINPGVIAVIRLAKNASDSDSPEVQGFLSIVQESARSGINLAESTETLNQATSTVKGQSADLDLPLIKLQSALVLVVETRAIYRGWIDEIADGGEVQVWLGG